LRSNIAVTASTIGVATLSVGPARAASKSAGVTELAGLRYVIGKR